MGEMADYEIERIPFTGRSRYRQPTVYGPPLKCKHCGATNVYWQRVRGTYVLTDIPTLARHVCPLPANTAEGFEECKI